MASSTLTFDFVWVVDGCILLRIKTRNIHRVDLDLGSRIDLLCGVNQTLFTAIDWFFKY